MLKLRNKKILVTGGTGKVGKVLVPMLSRKGAKVRVLSRSVGEDVADATSLDFTDIDYVVHMAACQNSEKRSDYYDVNVKGTQNAIKEAIRVGVKKFLYVSTVMVFEDTGGVERDEKYNIRDEYYGNYYADSKIKALKIIEKFKKKLPIVIVYPAVVLVKTGWYKPGSLMSLVGSGNRVTNYVSVEQVSRLMIKALVRGKNGDDYILGGKNIMAKDFCWFSFIRVPFFLIKNLVKNMPVDMCFSSKKINKL